MHYDIENGEAKKMSHRSTRQFLWRKCQKNYLSQISIILDTQLKQRNTLLTEPGSKLANDSNNCQFLWNNSLKQRRKKNKWGGPRWRQKGSGMPRVEPQCFKIFIRKYVKCTLSISKKKCSKELSLCAMKSFLTIKKVFFCVCVTPSHRCDWIW